MELRSKGRDGEMDLSIAEETLKERGSTIVVAKDGNIIYCTDTPGLKAIFEASERLKEKLIGSAVADKIVGKAAALLYAHLQVQSVFGELMSKGAVEVFQFRDMEYKFDRFVPAVKGKDGKDMCPFEMRVMNISTPGEGFEAVSIMLFGKRNPN